MQHFDSLQDYHDYMYWPQPEHPMFSIISLSSWADKKEIKIRSSSPPITSDFYTIKFKHLVSGNMIYGRTKYDFSKGCMLFISPRQILEWDNVVLPEEGFMLHIHEDFFIGHELMNKIKSYDFFSYSMNEALHLSQKEESIIMGNFENIESEARNNQDEFSKKIVLGHIETLLNYSERFYKRQFLNRAEPNKDLSIRFKSILKDYFELGKFYELGVPNLDWVANELSVSPRYLSRALKCETGKTAMEHLHMFLIAESKNLLLEPGKTVSEVAYQLGFEYPQYFSRLFKKKTGVSPKAYIDNHLIN